ncbi:MAG: GNAT family N-acetyltransferase [Pseudomonadota bacterium]
MTTHSHDTTVTIVDFDAKHRRAFSALNYEWIEKYFTVEAADRTVLDDPETNILAPGGRILIAEIDHKTVGTCALLRKDSATLELAKMAVAELHQGAGVGRALGEAAVKSAREMRASRIVLESNRRLDAALGLYRSLGFAEIAAEASDYTRCDIHMELRL